MDWRAFRDRWLASPERRSRIGRWPIGRRVADRHARRLFGVVAGFVETQMLTAALDLGVFERLRDGPRHWDDVVDLPPAGRHALKQALVASGLIEARGTEAGLTIDGLVVATDPGLQAMIRHNRLLYADLADPVGLLRAGAGERIASFWPYAGGEGDVAGYSDLMAISQGETIEAVLHAVDFAASRHVMDVGGGSGAFLRAVHQRHPQLQLTLVDLPAVVAATRSEDGIALCGVAADSPLPRGADTITLLRMLHDHDDVAAGALLARAAAALPHGGRIVVAEPMARAGRDPQTAYFAGYFAAMGSGRLRSSADIAALLHRAGFSNPHALRSSALLGILTAEYVATS